MIRRQPRAGLGRRELEVERLPLGVEHEMEGAGSARRRSARRCASRGPMSGSPSRTPLHSIDATGASRSSEADSVRHVEQLASRRRAAMSPLGEPQHVGVAVDAPSSRTSSSRRPGSRRCCCRPASGGPRRPSRSIGTPTRQQVERQEVPDLAVAQRLDRGVVGRALDAAVPAQVVVVAVAVVLAVRLVVLLVVGDQVVQREAVVAGHEVDRSPAARGRLWP